MFLGPKGGGEGGSGCGRFACSGRASAQVAFPGPNVCNLHSARRGVDKAGVAGHRRGQHLGGDISDPFDIGLTGEMKHDIRRKWDFCLLNVRHSFHWFRYHPFLWLRFLLGLTIMSARAVSGFSRRSRADLHSNDKTIPEQRRPGCGRDSEAQQARCISFSGSNESCTWQGCRPGSTCSSAGRRDGNLPPETPETSDWRICVLLTHPSRGSRGTAVDKDTT